MERRAEREPTFASGCVMWCVCVRACERGVRKERDIETILVMRTFKYVRAKRDVVHMCGVLCVCGAAVLHTNTDVTLLLPLFLSSFLSFSPSSSGTFVPP